MSSSTSSAAPAIPAVVSPGYVVIDIEALRNRRGRPFSNVLQEPKTKSGKKTRKNTFFYVFTADHDGSRYTKIGNSGDVKTYGSKQRFCPFVDFNGCFQVLQYGAMIERLVKAYLRTNYKSSEWYVNCQAKLDALLAAICANQHFQFQRPHAIVNVMPFTSAFIARHGGTENEYLSLFRIRGGNGALYRLTTANIEGTVASMLKPEFIDTPSTPAAPAAPGAGSWRMVAVQPAAPAAPTAAATAVVLVQ